MRDDTNPFMEKMQVKLKQDINWPNLAGQKKHMNEFWAVLYKDLTEPYMSKYQREEVFNRIKRKVFEERSEQIKKAKEDGKSFVRDTQNPLLLTGVYHNLNAYNLDNNDLDYIVYKKYLLKLYGLEKPVKKPPKRESKIKRPSTARRSSIAISDNFYKRLSQAGSQKNQKGKGMAFGVCV